MWADNSGSDWNRSVFFVSHLIHKEDDEQEEEEERKRRRWKGGAICTLTEKKCEGVGIDSLWLHVFRRLPKEEEDEEGEC